MRPALEFQHAQLRIKNVFSDRNLGIYFFRIAVSGSSFSVQNGFQFIKLDFGIEGYSQVIFSAGFKAFYHFGFLGFGRKKNIDISWFMVLISQAKVSGIVIKLLTFNLF